MNPEDFSFMLSLGFNLFCFTVVIFMFNWIRKLRNDNLEKQKPVKNKHKHGPNHKVKKGEQEILDIRENDGKVVYHDGFHTNI